VVVFFYLKKINTLKKTKPPNGLGLADIKFWKVILRQILIYFTLSDLTNEGWLTSCQDLHPRHEVCNRWQKLACGLRKLQGANLRPFLSAGWLLTRCWHTCSNEADAAMYSPVPANGKGIGE